MSQRELFNQIQSIMDKAMRSLKAASMHLDERDYDFAASRAYYAVFYCMEAVLLTKKLSFSKHSGVISAFNLHFIKEGIFPKEYGKYLHRLFRERHTGDYSAGLSISRTDAETDIQIAGDMTQIIKVYLEKQGFMTRINTDKKSVLNEREQ